CCARVVLRAELGERANYLQPPGPSYRRSPCGLPLRPIDDELQGQWSFVTGIVREARECQQSRTGNTEVVAKPAALVEILLHTELHGVHRRHGRLPGQD